MSITSDMKSDLLSLRPLHLHEPLYSIKEKMKIEFVILLFLTTTLNLSCKSYESNQDGNSIIYGCNMQNDSIVLIEPTNFENFEKLYDEVEEITCNGGITGIELDKKENSSILTFSNPCWENYACILIRRRNVFEIIDDSISFEKTYPIDSLTPLLIKHFENEGELPYYSDHPDKVIVSIKYKTNELGKLKNLLEQLILAYDKIENSKCLNVWLDGKQPPAAPLNLSN